MLTRPGNYWKDYVGPRVQNALIVGQKKPIGWPQKKVPGSLEEKDFSNAKTAGSNLPLRSTPFLREATLT